MENGYGDVSASAVLKKLYSEATLSHLEYRVVGVLKERHSLLQRILQVEYLVDYLY